MDETANKDAKSSFEVVVPPVWILDIDHRISYFKIECIIIVVPDNEDVGQHMQSFK